MKRVLVSLIFCLNICLGMSIPIYAEESSEMMGGYTIEGIPNSHQVDPNAGYFDLSEQPGETDQLKIKLINQSEREKKLSIKVTDGNTNSNGLVDYTGELKNHSLLKTPLSSILKPTQETVTVPAKKEVEATLNLTMPSQKFEGIILGGILVSDVTDTVTESKGMSIGNQYTYTLGVVLKNETQTDMYKNISVELESVEPKVFYGKKVVQANFLNPNPYILGEASVEGKIINEKNKKVVKEQKSEKVSIAPYSVYPFQFDWKKDEIKPGNYIFEGVVKTKDKKWKFSHKFSIEEEQAKEMNKKSVFKIVIPTWLKISSAVFVLLMITTSLWVEFRKGRRG
ncbi:DUF916 and DUF3324 domain-containing protein [Enterococcus faecium]|uniref:DUF916 and DUF3324 domain-containing protein n=1 Tax=Enterococcus faecium TaxID=1352 RepID=UPI0024140D04|nr:DUF916 and DUF3324 domain-containing protein [Enterococcus faecium]MDG4589182.1 DUF916 and DUF3324 domain-containing protein [Enterococcus faecium]